MRLVVPRRDEVALAMAPKERTFSIRTAMLILAVGSGVVAVAAALVVGWLSYREYRDRIGSSLVAASRAIMVSVDGELDQALAFVDGLSTSPNFVKGDFAALQVQAREALAPYVTFSSSSQRMVSRSMSTRTDQTPATAYKHTGPTSSRGHFQRTNLTRYNALF